MQLDSPVLLGNPSEVAATLGNISGATTVDLGQSSFQIATVTGAVTWTFTSDSSGLRGSLLQLTNAGAFAHTFPGYVKWPGGNPPTFTVAGVDFLSVFTPDGTTFYASLAMADAK